MSNESQTPYSTQFNWENVQAKDNNKELKPLTLVNFQNDQLPIITFLSNEPISSKPNQFGRTGYLFKVTTIDNPTEEKGFYTSSIRVMQLLKEFLPIANKSFSISRTGKGKETKYLVEEV